jgi:hypothetical protein
MTIPSQDLKTCSRCGWTKPVSEFYTTKYHSDKKRRPVSECKTCSGERRKANYFSDGLPERKVKEQIAAKAKRKRVRDAVFAAYGGYKCNCCGETEQLFLSIDHVNNDGAEFRRKLTGKRTSAGYHTYNWLIKNGFPDGYQVLCMNCNHGKRMNNGICPHKVRCNDQSKDVDSSESKRTTPHLTVVRG